jgi:hypothetical protein
VTLEVIPQAFAISAITYVELMVIGQTCLCQTQWGCSQPLDSFFKKKVAFWVSKVSYHGN